MLHAVDQSPFHTKRALSYDFSQSLQHLHKYLVALHQRDRPHQAILPGNASEHVANTATSLNASEIRRLIDQQNSKQAVYNEDVYGPLQNDSLVIVIQVCDLKR
jgi:alpha-1,6-mannosyl-glycoprotein beta-1,2-N-acetylglucosaminyltransferase